MKNEKKKILSVLKSPLLFFGFALIIVEASLGTVLVIVPHTTEVLIIMSVVMASLFLFSIVIVAFLVYKAPLHFMLGRQIATELMTKGVDRAVTLEISPEITVSRRAAFSIKSSKSISLSRVLENINELARFHKEKTFPARVKQLDMAGNVYVLRSSGDLRIIFQVCDNKIEILDIVRRSSLNSMFGRERPAEG